MRNSLRKSCSVVDLGNGSYTITSSGVKEQGIYQLRTWHAFPSGLKGEYYSDGFFENKVLSRIDRQVNFTWGFGRLIPRGTDYVTIRWSGAILTNASAIHNFYVDADDHARLWIGGELLLDHWHERGAYLEPPRSIYLRGKQLYEVVLEYREVTGIAFARLMWSFNNISMQVIPASNLFSLHEINRSPVLVTILSSTTNANTSECIGDGLYSGIALQKSFFKVCPRDAFGNMRDDIDEKYLETEQFEASLVLQNDLGYNGVGVEYILPVFNYNSNEHCFETSYTPQHAGQYRLDVYYYNPFTDSRNALINSPFYLTFQPDRTSGPKSNVVGLPSVLHMIAGNCHNFTIVARDNAQNLRKVGGDDFEVLYFYFFIFVNRFKFFFF
jgi:hypothetical protein